MARMSSQVRFPQAISLSTKHLLQSQGKKPEELHSQVERCIREIDKKKNIYI